MGSEEELLAAEIEFFLLQLPGQGQVSLPSQAFL